MKLSILIGALIVLFLLLVVTRSMEGFDVTGLGTNPPTIPTNFIDQSLLSDRIANAPAPAGTDQTGKLIYSAADIEADITKLKNEVDNIQMNTPGYVKQEVSEQLFHAMGSLKKNMYAGVDQSDIDTANIGNTSLPAFALKTYGLS